MPCNSKQSFKYYHVLFVNYGIQSRQFECEKCQNNSKILDKDLKYYQQQVLSIYFLYSKMFLSNTVSG